MPSQTERERLIFETLFPDTSYSCKSTRQRAGIETQLIDDPRAFKWKNRLCDAQAFWGS